MSLSRLSDLNVQCDIVRAYLYQDILDAIISSRVKCQTYEIRIDEKYRADLVAFRVYGTVEAKWLVMLLCDVEEEIDPLPVSQDIQFPDVSFIRERIRYFSEKAELPLCLN